ncbi:GumC family protein [Pseudomonas sp. UBA2684]|uniref:GumC family protein n=1 Tax=Pseudomonas sp. UBA2684 TaxID=1947311 RepID=UPI000E979F83|nr:GumC family protein [Pseudomonas sp. UBA2684]HBX57831.1 lipopolysaccharide biosynthesis protein [Pseudomonas sp.]|tara:strand:+ start:14191 stop:16182 length:1992 start_codon:yes stop_codon:yes gene_type:complete
MIEIRTFRDVLRLFFIFKREFLVAVCVTLLMILLGAFFLPTSYESNSRLLVKPGRDSNTLPIEMTDRTALVVPATQRDPIVDEERLLTGRPIIRQVAERYYELAANAPGPQGFFATVKHGLRVAGGAAIDLLRDILALLGLIEEQTPVERLAKKLEKEFSVSHAPGSSVMEISFTWDDPAVAQTIVKIWVDIYLQERTRVLGRKSLYDFYDTQLRTSESNIDRLKQQILVKLKSIDAIEITERLQDLSERINQLRTDRFNSTRLIAATEGSLNTLDQQIRSLPGEVRTVRELSLNPEHQHILQLLNNKRAERQDLLRTFTEQAPPIKTIDQSIAYLEERVASEAAVIQSSENRAPNPVAERLQSNRFDQQSDVARLKAQLSRQDMQLASLEAERDQSMAAEPVLAQLQRALSVEEKNYALYADSLEKARIDRELDNSSISNIAIIEEATLNPSRVFPKSLLMLALSIPAALMVGLLVLYICYLLDQRIHDGGHIESRFGVPLWTTLQELDDRQAPNSAFIASIYRLYAQLPLEQIEQKGLILAFTSAGRGEGVGFVIQHLAKLLGERGHHARLDSTEPTKPGEVALLAASSLLSNQDAFVTLRHADMIVMVIEARQSTIPVVSSALNILTTAFKKVDGIIVNRRRFEVPHAVLNLMARLRALS